ncbi:glycolate oxidase subunit GlcE [Novosphingobium malaysiense]|uniref:FAD-linked oxidase n=1 Tax=Novosphingobium malaysiense TaxID=1348853 RepID=A0A0B1ZKW2_9SPHN|nr:glycolate oxidase subunit GlcE [Novosphingobium malaysiense]KHK89818.1 FAD-linked oxidase [Novosphingobium malaysiense]
MDKAMILRPADEQELCETVRAAASAGTRLSLEGGGSKVSMGRPVDDCRTLSLGAFSGIADYDPPELVLTAGAATPLSQIESALAENNQMLAFEPFDLAPILGGEPGVTTIGGVVASGLAGSQRLVHGGVRDHLLGFRAVSGRGDAFVAGGKVVKNVTGYDLSKLMCGSWGRLAALMEVTLKVLPRPASQATLIARDLDPRAAWASFARLLGSQAEIAAAAHFPPGTLEDHAISAVRLQGFAPSVDARAAMVERIGSAEGYRRADASVATGIWASLRDLSVLPRNPAMWRVSLPARQAPDFLEAFAPGDVRWVMDWAGGLIWLSTDRPAEMVRTAAQRCNGHAMLLRASADIRRAVPTLHTQPDALARLEERVRRAFDPASVFETGRF